MTNEEIKKVVIFCGGQGTRLGELTHLTPKPMIQVGDAPIVVHIMRHFYSQGYKEFFLLLGYKSEEFKKYFRDYYFQGASMTFAPGGAIVHPCNDKEDWTVHLIETGEDSTTGQRLAAASDFVGRSPFFLTYGDSHSDVDLKAVEKQLFESDNLATITAVPIAEKFGVLSVDDDGSVKKFAEKSSSREQLINGGFIACRPELFDRVNEDSDDFSFEALTKLSEDGKLGYYLHNGFWQAMDSKRDHDKMVELYNTKPELFKRK